jgi:hypothetical protein
MVMGTLLLNGKSLLSSSSSSNFKESGGGGGFGGLGEWYCLQSIVSGGTGRWMCETYDLRKSQCGSGVCFFSRFRSIRNAKKVIFVRCFVSCCCVDEPHQDAICINNIDNIIRNKQTGWTWSYDDDALMNNNHITPNCPMNWVSPGSICRFFQSPVIDYKRLHESTYFLHLLDNNKNVISSLNFRIRVGTFHRTQSRLRAHDDYNWANLPQRCPLEPEVDLVLGVVETYPPWCSNLISEK